MKELGQVTHIVAPNKIHSLGIGQWKDLFPEAKSWVSPGFEKRHPDFEADAALADAAPSEWHDEIDQHVFQGSAFLDEVVFCHRASGTLIVTDLIQRHDADAQSWFWRIVKGWAGILGKGGTARDLRASFRDRDAARHSRDLIMRWDFEKSRDFARGVHVGRGETVCERRFRMAGLAGFPPQLRRIISRRSGSHW